MKSCRKYIALLLVAGALGAAGAGCGSGGPATTDPQDSLVPNYQQPINNGRDAANQERRQEQQTQDYSKQLETP